MSFPSYDKFMISSWSYKYKTHFCTWCQKIEVFVILYFIAPLIDLLSVRQDVHTGQCKNSELVVANFHTGAGVKCRKR